MSFLQSAAQWLSGVRSQTMTVTVGYSAAGAAAVEMEATPLQFDADRLAEGSAEIASQVQDWLFVASAFASRKPAGGDVITDATGLVWEVAEPPGGGEVWWYADEYQTEIRVHTVRG